MKKIIALMCCFISFNAFAIQESPKGQVTGYYTGWGGDSVRVTIEGAAYTEGSCATPDGYLTSETDNSGYKTHTAALLSAYMSGKPVKIVVNGCMFDRPRIWGVSID